MATSSYMANSAYSEFGENKAIQGLIGEFNYFKYVLNDTSYNS